MPVDQALKEEFSRQDVAGTAEMEAQKEFAVGLESQLLPSLLASNLNPCLVYQGSSKTPHNEQTVQMAEALNPAPDHDMASWAKVLQASGDSPQTQTLKIHIDRTQHQSQRGPFTPNMA